MKYLQLIFAISIIIFLAGCGKNDDSSNQKIPKPLGEIQSVWTQQKNLQDSLKQDYSLSKDQEILFDISDILNQHGQQYYTTLTNILKKYKTPLLQQDIDTLVLLLSQNLQFSEIKTAILQQLSISILESDLKKMRIATMQFADEKEVQKKRLSLKQESQIIAYTTQRDTLIKNMIQDILSSKTHWTQVEIENVIHEILRYFYHNNYSSDIESFTQIIETLQEEYTLVIHTESITNDSYEFDQLSFIDFMQELSESYDTTLEYTQHIEEYISYVTSENIIENIITEVTMIEGDTPIVEYETIISERTQQIESIFETQEIISSLTIEETHSYFEKELDYSQIEILHQERDQEINVLPDIMTQVLQQDYIDDSSLISDLTPLAYVQDISGNILVKNLAGGIKIAQENMLLYAGYSLESYTDSEATIIFSDESLLRLEENSSITLTESSSQNQGVHIEYGNIWTRVIKPLFSNDSFHIESQSVSLAVRGTSVYVQKQLDSELKVYVVDSYVTDGSQAIQLTNTVSGENITLSSGEVYQNSDENSTGTKENFTRTSLMQEESQVSSHLRDDVSYLSLLIDDRDRGFYNNPIGGKNDSKNFIDKISGELEVSLPDTSESVYFFENNETPKTALSADNIYLRLMQDELISDIKENPGTNKNTKISAIASLDIEQLQEDIGNLRELENRLDLEIHEQLLESNTLSPESVQDTFITFGLEEEQAKMKKLTIAKQHFIDTLNNGSPYITDDIELPTTYQDIKIRWNSNKKSYLGNDGSIVKYSPEEDIIISLTATFFLGYKDITHTFPIIIKKKELSDEQQLFKSYQMLREYISSVQVFSNTIVLPDFNEKGALIPTITWNQDEYVNSDGTLKRPEYGQGDKEYHTAIATLSLGDATWEGKKFTLKAIAQKPLWDESIQAEYDFSLAESTFPGCDTQDVKLANGQVWAMCNAGSNTTGLTSDSYGGYYLYQYNEAINACDVDGYRTPNRNDWNKLANNFNDIYSDIEKVMQIPKAGYEDLYWNNTWEEVGNKGYFWTSEKKSSCSRNCGYAFYNGNIVRMATHYDRLSVRCIREDAGTDPGTITEVTPTPEDIANQLLINEENRLIPYFENPIIIENNVLNIKDKLSGLNPNVTYKWSGAATLVDTYGTISSPSYNDGEKNKTLTLTLSHNNTQVIKTIKNISVILERQDCDGKIIDGECYELVASAEYDTAGDLDLISSTGAVLSNLTSSSNIINGCTTSDTAGNCAWKDTKDAINTEYGYDLSKVTASDGRKSWMTYDNQSGIVLDNVDSPDYLSYDLSSLELGDEWAIEMSVRGEDLKRDDSVGYYLLASPSDNGGNFAITSEEKNFRLIYSGGVAENRTNTSTIGNGYQKIMFTPQKHLIKGVWKNNNTNLIINQIIKVGSSRTNGNQWNGIINYINIYKKN